MPRLLHLLGALAALPVLAPGQIQWQKNPSPGPRSHHAIAFDDARGRLVVFGGDAANTGYSSTTDFWEWDGAAWSRPAPAVLPPVLHYAQMAYAPALGGCVLAGRAYQGTTWTDHCWLWDGSLWTRLGDTPTQGHLAYDGLAQHLVLISPGTFPGPLVVREWDGAQWLVRNTTGTVPTWFDLRRWSFDAARGCLVMPGIGQLYELHGTVWQHFQPAWSPAIASTNFFTDLHTVSYDANLGGVVVCGGEGGNGNVTGEAAWWNGTQWQQLPATAPRQEHAAAFDGVHGRLLVFGGRRRPDGFVPYPAWRYLGDLQAFDTAWNVLFDDSSPGHLEGTAAAFDASRGAVVTFGGAWDSTPVDESYVYDGEGWRPENPAARPSARAAAAMTFDTLRGQLVLFGGTGTNGRLGDTWVHDAQGWHLLATAHAPSPRAGAQMTFDSGRGVAVLVGGETAGGNSNETWEFDGTDWQLRIAGYPPASAYGAIAFDPRRGRTVLYGGYSGDAAYEWDGSLWYSQYPYPRPTPDQQGHCAMTYDAARQRIVLVHTTYQNPETWEWDGSAWTTTTAPGLVDLVAGHPQFLFVPALERCALLPGAGYPYFTKWTTGLYGSVHPATSTTFGVGCGSNGVPALTALARPWLGDTFAVQLSHPGASLGALAIGLSATTWAGGNLPFALGPAMPGCDLLTSAEAFRTLVLAQGTATHVLALPTAPALVGLELVYQGFAADAAANAAGIAASAGLAATLGVR